MKNILTLVVLSVLLLITGKAYSQNWQLVWSDDFNGSIGPDWSFDIGNTGASNNELEYYRQENASIQNNMLVITAKHESFGGLNYTSARMKTQGHKSWAHGKIDARIAMPSFQGVWPAFWMLGDNISSVGWPTCGEIDIMEHVNTGGEIYGSTHWTGTNGGQADYSINNGSQDASKIVGFHDYSVEWTPTTIKWFIDGVPLTTNNAFDITNGVGGTGAYQNTFFILLNMAIGGNFPGSTVDNSAFPANMYVDYVYVYQDAGSGGTPTGPAGYTWVVNENGSYNFTQTVDVAYGANGSFAYKTGVSGNITFNNATFGDPAPGVAKAGFYRVSTSTPTGPAGYTWVTNENGSYTFNQTVDVAYGANGSFNYKTGVSGTITFNNATFGDPIPGVAKAGFYRVSSGGSGTTYAVFVRSTGQALDASGAGTANTTPLIQSTYHGGTNQQWTITSQGNGQYNAIGVASGRAAEVYGAAQTDNAVVDLYDWNGGTNQKFTEVTQDSGYFNLVFVHSGKAMEVLNNATANGAAIVQYTLGAHGYNAQWQFRAP